MSKHPYEKEEFQDIDFCVVYVDKKTGEVVSADSIPPHSFGACMIRVQQTKPFQYLDPDVRVEVRPRKEVPNKFFP